jgi:hypothetical protein
MCSDIHLLPELLMRRHMAQGYGEWHYTEVVTPPYSAERWFFCGARDKN